MSFQQVIEARLAQLHAHRIRLELTIAQAYTPYSDDAQVAQLPGEGLLQMYFFSPEENAHTRALLARLQPPSGARLLDVGCGNGHFAALVRDLRPDLDLILLNRSQVQLAQCPRDLPRVAGDMMVLPVRSASVDAILLSYVLGYGLPEPTLAECARVLRPGGSVLFYDVVTSGLTADYMLVTLGYKCYPPAYLHTAAQACGLKVRHAEVLSRVDESVTLHPGFVIDLPWEVAQACITETMPVCIVWEKDVSCVSSKE